MLREFNLKIDWLFLSILLIPTFYLSGFDLRTSQTAFFEACAIALLAIFCVNKYVGAFLGYCLVQSVCSPYFWVDLGHLRNLFYGVFVFNMVALFSKNISIKKYYWAFFIVLLINIVWCARQYFNVDPIFQMADFDKQQIMTEQSGFFGLPAFLGNYCAAVLPFCFSLAWPLCLFSLAGIGISKSSFSIAAALCSALFYLWFKKRIIFWVAAALLIPASFFYVTKYDMPSGQFERRLNVWAIVEKLAFQRHFFGHGLGKYKEIIVGEVTPTQDRIATANLGVFKNFLIQSTERAGKPELSALIAKADLSGNGIMQVKKAMQRHEMDFELWHEAHNDYLQAFFETGLFGLFLILGYIVNQFKAFFKYKNAETLALMASFIAILIVSFGHFPFHLARLGGPFVIILGLLEGAFMRARRGLVSAG